MNKYLILALTTVISVAGVSCTEIVPTSYDKGVSTDLRSVNFIGDGESKVIKITSNNPWELDLGDNSWISVSKKSGEATEKVIITCEKNPSAIDSRTADITITSGEHKQTVTVTQKNYEVWIVLDKNGETHTAYAIYPSEDVELSLESNTSWTVEAPQGFILSQSTGNGDATISLTIDNSSLNEDSKSSEIKFISDENPAVTQSFFVNQVRPKAINDKANTHIIKEAGIYSIPATKSDGTTFSNASSATWLFKTAEDIVSDILYYDGRIYFKINKIGGYGSVVLQNEHKEILWSYMLWCTAEAKDITIGKDVWMDRTVGAWTNNLPSSDFSSGSDESACGAYFQWGRKDPFPGPSTSGLSQKTRTEAAAFGEYTLQYVFNSDIATAFVVDTTDPASVANTTRYPWKYANKAIGDSNVATLWTDDSKGLHDPCPAGYKVPTAQQILDFASELADSWTCDESWSAPNSWSRKYSKDGVEFTLINSSVRTAEGKTFNAGRESGGWSSTYNTSKAGNAHRFYAFKKGQAIASPLGYASIAEGYPVRCVKIN